MRPLLNPPLILMYERFQQYLRLMRVDRPIGFWLLLWPSLWALWIAADGLPELWILVVFVLGTFLMRSAGCVINDFADRKIDPHVERTKLRPLAAGKVSAREALVLFVLLSLLAFALVLTLNQTTVLLSVVGAFLAASYPFMKRYTHLPQAYLGIAFAWGVPMAFAAQSGMIPAASWWLFAATVFWATAYDTLYAMVDRDDDLKIGVKSTAILFGRFDLAAVAVLDAMVLVCLSMAGAAFALGPAYFVGLSVALLLMVNQLRAAHGRDKQQCFQAFLNNNWVGLAVFAGLLIDRALPWPA